MDILEDLPEEVRNLLPKFKENDPRLLSKIEASRLVIREKAKSNLWYFCYNVCGFKDIKTTLHVNMCDRMEGRLHHPFTLWLIPRSHLKTTLWTVGTILWELINDPDIRFLVVNARLDNARDMLRDVSKILSNNEVFRWLFPDYCTDLVPKKLANGCIQNNSRIDLPCSKYAGRKEGNIEVASYGANLTSKHYDRMIYDDIVNEDNVATKDLRDKVWSWYRNTLQLRDNPITSVVRIIGTRWHYDDLYARIINRENKHRERQEERKEKVKPIYLFYTRRAVENGEPIWPERFTLEILHHLKHEELGSYIYSCQYDNNPVPEEDAVFKKDQIKYAGYWDIPEVVNNVITIDLADEETTRGDFTVITVSSFDSDGNMYVRSIIRDKLSLKQVLDKVANLTRKWKPLRVGIETTAFQKALYREIKRQAVKAGINIPWIEITRGKTSKYKRVLGLQPRVERGDFYIEEGIENTEWLVEEMVTFPMGAFDDILDTVVDAENIFISAAVEVEEEKPEPNTFEAVIGSLFEEENSFRRSSWVIGREDL